MVEHINLKLKYNNVKIYRGYYDKHEGGASYLRKLPESGTTELKSKYELISILLGGWVDGVGIPGLVDTV